MRYSREKTNDHRTVKVQAGPCEMIVFIMATVLLLSMVGTFTGTGSEDGVMPRTRGTEYGKGSMMEVNLEYQDLVDLEVDQDGLKLQKETLDIRDEMDDLDNAVQWENLREVPGETSVQHIFRSNYGGKGEDRASRCIETSDGGFVIVGSTGSSGIIPSRSPDLWLLKIDGKGREIWNTT
ncbi:MAG: hypothetical protein ACMUHB_06710, partial [Thermoplasmatota archaeon]